MTIGQRIAQRRKILGLSQEALGDKMGVSRQAISKWEADAALPEIDKLIALSKLFGVTVGWLLGVEEPVQQEQDPLTEEQLNAMEQLIKIYTAPSQPEPKRGRLSMLLSALALVLSGVTLLTCLTHHNNLSNSLSSLSYQMINLQSGYDTVRAQINDLQTAESAPAIPSELHGFDLHLTPSQTEPKVTVQLSAVPKQRTDERAVFTARKDGAEVASADCVFDGTAYTAEVELDLADGYEYWLVLTTNDGVQQQIPLEDSQAQNLNNTFTLTCKIDRDAAFLSLVNGDLCLNGLTFSMRRPISMEDGADYLWNRIEIVTLRNGEEVYRDSVLSPDDDLDIRRSVDYGFGGAIVFAYPRIALKDGDGIEVWLIAEVSNGMVCKEMVGSWRYEQAGDNGIFHGGELVEQD